MARIFITGSADGLGLMVARLLIRDGHQVIQHARSKERAEETLWAGAETSVAGDFSVISDIRSVAEQVNALGPVDVVIHNAGVGFRERRIETLDGLEHVFAINTLAPYLLTALINRPQRLIYLSSGMHRQGDPDMSDLQWRRRRWNSAQAYSDSKLHDVLLAFAVARLWPEVRSNALEPGWVATKMGGAGAPDDMSKAPLTQVWLAEGGFDGSGQYFYHQKQRQTHPAAHDRDIQQQLLEVCAELTGVELS